MKKDKMTKGCRMGSSSCRKNKLYIIANFVAALLLTAGTNAEQRYLAHRPKLLMA